MPRVLHVTECYAGGVSRAIESVVALADQSEHHLLWSGDERPSAQTPYASVHALPKNLLGAVAAVHRTIRLVRPDVVHAHSSWAGVFTRVTPLAVPVIYEPHCYKFDDEHQAGLLRQAYRLAERALAPRSISTVVLSPHEGKLARDLNPRAAIHFLPNVASAAPNAQHAAVGFETDRTVTMVGRLGKQKDPLFFAEVAQRTVELTDARFRWIGDGEARDRRLLENAGVVVTGWLQAEELAAELATPSLYFHSARYEGFPLSVLDAAAFEHPVAARAIPAFEGLGVPTALDVEGSARLIVDILGGGSARTAAIKASAALHASMTKEAQGSALRDLYAAVQPSASRD